ncbi:hypothetical protein PENSOL_c287G04925, partial [Penicillium solitum]
MPEADDAPTQFLDAISVMSPSFHDTWTLRLQDQPEISFTELLNRYKAHWSITHGRPAKALVDSKRIQMAKSKETSSQQANATFDEYAYGFFSTEASKPSATNHLASKPEESNQLASNPEKSNQIDVSTTIMSTQIQTTTNDFEPVEK